MPSISIDTFFACTLMVSVVIISTISITGTMVTRVNSWKNLNEETYLKTISDNILTSAGTPYNWGSDPNVKPVEFGLALTNLHNPSELDPDKICRLNTQNDFSISYTDVLKAARLPNIAMKLSLSQIMNVSTSLSSNIIQGNSTNYTFRISVNQNSGPIPSSLHCYLIARDFMQDEYNETSTDGIGYANFRIPNNSNGTAALIVFARAKQNSMMTAFNVQLFTHLSSEPFANGTFLDLSPLNYTLHITMKSPNTILEDSYALSYSYRTNLGEYSNKSLAIPKILDNSPIVIVVTSQNSNHFFVEWTSYPQVPLETGANFKNSESYVFSYVVIIKETLYKLTIILGDTNT